MSHDPIALLAAALQTERPELVQAFVRQVHARLDEEHSLDAETSRNMVTAIFNLFGEVYDLRRTVRAMQECNKHIHQALNGCQKHLEVAREIGNRGAAGTLPEEHDAPSIMAAVKADLIAESD